MEDAVKRILDAGLRLVYEVDGSNSGQPGAGVGSGAGPTLLTLAFRVCVFMNIYCIIHVFVDSLYARAAAARFRLSFSERISVAEKVCSSLNAIYTSSAAFTIIFWRADFNPSAFTGAQCTSPMSTILNVYPTAPANATYLGSFLDADWFLPAYIGYSIYDCATMYFQGDNHWSMWVHHLVGIYGAAGNLRVRSLSALSTFAMGTEITAFFVNLVWYAETLNLQRPSLRIARRSSITTAMGDEEDTVTPSLTPSSSSGALPNADTSDKKLLLAKDTAPAAAVSVKKRKPRADTKAPATLTLVVLQFLRTFSFLVFRVTAVPLSFYLLATLGGTAPPSLARLGEMVVVVWNGCSACARAWWDWDVDRFIGFSALIVQMLFGLLNVVWTFVAVKVARRDLGRYLRGREKAKAE
ncbi:hypothetical protein BC830DRAFT_1095967 [Chytriomyces sp. MP71]|nr:hypothetical protein BC830DRAFT_1095967 [Chytriomyces sp. MP71]